MHTAQIQLISIQSHCLLRLDVRTLHRSLMTVYLLLFSRQISMQTGYFYLHYRFYYKSPSRLSFVFLLFREQHSSRKKNTKYKSIFASEIRLFSSSHSQFHLLRISFFFLRRKKSTIYIAIYLKSTMNEKMTNFLVKNDFCLKYCSYKVCLFSYRFKAKISDLTKIFMTINVA